MFPSSIAWLLRVPFLGRVNLCHVWNDLRWHSLTERVVSISRVIFIHCIEKWTVKEYSYSFGMPLGNSDFVVIWLEFIHMSILKIHKQNCMNNILWFLRIKIEIKCLDVSSKIYQCSQGVHIQQDKSCQGMFYLPNPWHFIPVHFSIICYFNWIQFFWQS